jgi:formate hydrogenlyase subunit 6/NADH:ubiquinone oxidoreductase subunit I
MSWERAENHSCSDGRPCSGHKVNVEYVKSEIDSQLHRVARCGRCNESCTTETIENQNYRDMTGRRSACVTRKKKAIPCKVWRDPETGKTMKEMMKELTDIKKKYNLQ